MEQLLLIILPLLIGYVLDLIFGDPRNIPHPVIGFGHSITFCTRILNRGKHLLFKGAVITILLVSTTFICFYFISELMLRFSSAFYILFASIFVFYGLANKSLLQEGVEVFQQLKKNGLEAGRKRLSWIVGRDTSNLSEQEIRLAVFETLSENLSDGVVAPLFYYAIGGVPGMMCYKMINTLDSMIGYKNEKYILFGRVAARLDDIANFIPARLTALLMILVTLKPKALHFVIKYGNAHTSPNAGYPESALAGILNCRFGGTNTYGGISVNKPFIGHNNRLISDKEIHKIRYINHAVCLVSIIIVVAIYAILNSEHFNAV